MSGFLFLVNNVSFRVTIFGDRALVIETREFLRQEKPKMLLWSTDHLSHTFLLSVFVKSHSFLDLYCFHLAPPRLIFFFTG